MPEFSEQTQKLIQRHRAWYESLQIKEGASFLHVDEVASKVAAFYEKLRGIIEWKEEHLLRRAAIERMLKRRVFLMEDGEDIAGPLVLELIRGGHFPNDSIEERKVMIIQRLIQKYVFIIKNSPPSDEKLRIQLFGWILGIAACEVENVLSPRQKEIALIDFMTDLMTERIKIKEGVLVVGGISEEEKKKQIFIAVQRALFKLDPSIISYHLLRFYYPKWEALPQEQFEQVAHDIYSIQEKIEKDLKHRLAENIYKIFERYDTSYLILGDILSQDPAGPQEKLSQPEKLEYLVTEAYNKRLKSSKEKL